MEKMRWEYDQRLRDSRDGTNLSFERDLAYGFSWPQRNYRCSFCNKEFKSAQALGGHMNVHRRDRARMRLSPNPNPNPNPSLPLPSHLPSTAKFLPCNLACISMMSPSPFPTPSSPFSLQEDKFADLRGEDFWKTKKKKNEGKKHETTNLAKRHDVIRLDLSLGLGLGLGLIQDAKDDSGTGSGSDLDLDLELRLGCCSRD